jgi:hypothetical protein
MGRPIPLESLLVSLDQGSVGAQGCGMSRGLALVVAVAVAGCGSPVLFETSSPPGKVINAIEEPEAFAACRWTDADDLGAGDCPCATLCPEGVFGERGECVLTGTVSRHRGGACPQHMSILRAQVPCEIPDWPLYRCDPERLSD